MNPYTPSPEQQQANDEALARAIALIYQPLTWRQRREVDRQVAAVRGLLAYQDRRRRGVR